MYSLGRGEERSQSKGKGKYQSKFGDPKDKMRCYLCNKMGNFKRDCPKKGKSTKGTY